MNKKTKLKILRKALKRGNYNSECLESFEDLGDRVDDEPTEFIELCVEEAFKEGKTYSIKGEAEKNDK